MVPMNQAQFNTVDYSYNQLIQAIGRMNEAEKLLRQVGMTVSAAKIANASRMVRQEADHIREALENN